MLGKVGFFLILLSATSGYKILGIFPHSGKSHFDVFEPLMKALAAKGHEITVISYFPQKTPVSNIIDIDISTGPVLLHAVNVEDFNGARWQKYITPLLLAYFGHKSCHEGLPQKNLQDFIKSEPKFDLILIESFNNQCFLGITHKIKTPVISLSSCMLMPWHDNILALNSNPAYLPNTFMPYSTHMSFLERVENTVLYLLHNLVYKLFMDLPGNWAARKYLGDDVADLKDLEANISMTFVNSHFSFTNARPLVPGHVEVAGMHLGKPKKVPSLNWEIYTLVIYNVLY